MILKRESCSNNTHKDIYKCINNYDMTHIKKEKISCCIFITDMFSDIEEYQNIMSSKLSKIYLTLPSSIEYYDKKVKGILIPIED